MIGKIYIYCVTGNPHWILHIHQSIMVWMTIKIWWLTVLYWKYPTWCDDYMYSITILRKGINTKTVLICRIHTILIGYAVHIVVNFLVIMWLVYKNNKLCGIWLLLAKHVSWYSSYTHMNNTSYIRAWIGLATNICT